MPKVFVTGVCGMIGSHLAETLISAGHSVEGSFYRPTIDMTELPADLPLRELDIRYPLPVCSAIEELRPDWIFHLAAQSYPAVSWSRPNETLDTNVVGTANVFEAVKALRKRDPSYDPVVVVACSSAEYGASFLTSAEPIKEGAELLPLHPYGVSKVATDLLAYQYFRSDGIRSVRARIFNTSGPRKAGDVISDYARRIVAATSDTVSLRVGALSTKRAFLHVRDMVAALTALAAEGHPGEVYNISGTEVVSIADLLPMFEHVSGRRIVTAVDPALLRPSDEPIIWGDNTRIVAHTGWTPRARVLDIVADVYGYQLAKAAQRQAAQNARH